MQHFYITCICIRNPEHCQFYHFLYLNRFLQTEFRVCIHLPGDTAGGEAGVGHPGRLLIVFGSDAAS